MSQKPLDAESILELAQAIEIGMLTSHNRDRGMGARPMQLVEICEDSCLWFFVHLSSQVVEDIEAHPEVCISFANPADSTYISITGEATTVIDADQRDRLWNPMLRSWFPNGVDDPECMLIKIKPKALECWQGSSWKIVRLTEQLLAIAMGREAHPDQHTVVSAVS